MELKTAMWKRIVLLLAVLLFAAGCAYFADRAAYQKFQSYEAAMPVSTVYSNDADIVRISDCEVKDGVYTVTGADPQFVVDASGQEILGIRIMFNLPLLQDTFLQIFLAPVGEGFSEENSVSRTIAAGEKEAEFLIPQREYSAFRFDFEQNVRIDRIYAEKNQHLVLEDKPDIVRMVTVFSIIFLPLCVLILIYKREEQ